MIYSTHSGLKGLIKLQQVHPLHETYFNAIIIQAMVFYNFFSTYIYVATYRRRRKIRWGNFSLSVPQKSSQKHFRIPLAITAHYLVQLKRGA